VTKPVNVRQASIAASIALLTLAPQTLSAAQVPQQCSAIPQSRDATAAEFDKAWVAKREAIDEHIKTLRELKKKLDDSYWLWIGKAGGGRELITILAMVTKTTTDLIQDLAPLGGEMVSLPLKLLQTSADIANMVNDLRQNKDDWYVDAGLKAGEELNPVTTGLVALRNLTKNTLDMANLQDDLEESRKVYREQMEQLDRQLDAAEKKIDDLERTNRDKAVDRLFTRWQGVQRSCQILADKCELESFDSCPEHPVSDGLKRQDAKLHKWYVCLAEQKARDKAAAGPDSKLR
jgi:hypothetical protein